MSPNWIHSTEDLIKKMKRNTRLIMKLCSYIKGWGAIEEGVLEEITIFLLNGKCDKRPCITKAPYIYLQS
ncbi:Hypothetical protein FKW44_008074, partial [Caligus rogercresseyi]